MVSAAKRELMIASSAASITAKNSALMSSLRKNRADSSAKAGQLWANRSSSAVLKAIT